MHNYLEAPWWRSWLTPQFFLTSACVTLIGLALLLCAVAAFGKFQQIATETAAAAVQVVLRHHYQLYPYPKRAEPI